MAANKILGVLTLSAMGAFNHASTLTARPAPAPTTAATDTTYDPGTLQSAYSKFIAATPERQIDIQLKENQDAPGIRDDYKRASAGIDVVNDDEVSGLAGRRTHVYRSNPMDAVQLDLKAQLQDMYAVIDRKILTGQWGAAEQAELDRKMTAAATATGLDRSQLEQTVRHYEEICRDDNETKANGFGYKPSTPLKSEVGHLLTTQALGGTLTAEDQGRLDGDLAQLRKGPGAFSAADLHFTVSEFQARVRDEAAERRVDMADDINEDAQEARNGFGNYYDYEPDAPVPGAPEHSAVPKTTGTDAAAKFAAWFVITPDLPSKPPPGSSELADFLVSLHESEHNARRGESIAPAALSGAAHQQAKEIDADYAVLKYLDQAKEPAVKEYWLQAREVDSFSFGVNGTDTTHDTATFLRLYQKTGEQLDIDKFNREKHGLMTKLKDKLDLQPDGNSRTNVGNLMGAMQDLLKDDKAQTDPAKKLSPMQLAEANSFLHDADAMGYKANPAYPHAKPATPTTTSPAKSSSPAAAPAVT